MKTIRLKIFGSVASLFIVTVLLIVSSVVVFRPRSFAWFADNREVGAGGMQLAADTLDITMTYYIKGPFDTEYVKIETFESVFDGLMPGDTVWLKVAYESGEAADHSVKVYLDSFDGCETPLLIDGRYYYFSTQLKAVELDKFLLAPPADKLSYEAQQTLPSLELGTLTAAANSVSEFEFSVQFVNYTDVNQNAYQGFGTLGEGERCYRVISSEFD